ncbi:hypothetical protein [Methanosarcina barkeri]|nr:hypothetical protein [Methanosarcina barkeri]
MDIPMVGVASIERWSNPPFLPWMPEEFYPQSIYPEAKSVIVIGLPPLRSFFSQALFTSSDFHLKLL